ncbi:MAG TPA: hypothetical protein VFX82_16180 [Desulfobacterales bacterium]|nr:hypothetical protein [Desulfobacterales bacterium]
MKTDDEKKEKSLEGPRRIYLPKARVLGQQELDSLSEKEKTFAKECKDKGIWLELFCPDDACLLEEERIKLPVFCENPKHDHSLWLDIFCPGGSCEVTDSTKLP